MIDPVPPPGPRPFAVSWHTSVLLAYLNDEPNGRRCGEVIAAVESGRATLIVSTVVLAEVLRPRYSAALLRLVDRIFELPGVFLADVTPAVARLASSLRAECFAETPRRKLKTPDALILATAVLRCDAFYTLDRKLRKLKGRAFLRGLTVSQPPAT